MQERPVALREPIDAGAEQRLHARRERRSERGDVEVDPARLAPDEAALEEKAHDLLGEQRVSLRLLRDQFRQLLGKFIGAEARLHDARGLSTRERLERQRTYGALLPPWRPVLGPPCMHDHQGQPPAGFDDLAQQLFGRAVDPVKILKRHQHGRGATTLGQKLLQKIARLEPDERAVKTDQRTLRRL